MLAFGLQFQGQPVVDGKIHRVPGPSSKNKKDLAAWYSATLYDSGLIYATFGDWHHQDRWEKWSSKDDSALTASEREQITAHQAKVKAEREREQAEAAQEACNIWNSALPSAADHPYLALKQIQPHDTRVTPDGKLIVPVLIDGYYSSLQFIDKDSGKRFLTGGKVGGGSYLIPGDPQTAIVCEGFATAATLAKATGFTTYCAFNAGNLEKVVGQVKAKHPTVIVAGDEDKWTTGNPGRRAAEAAAQKHGCQAVFPTFSDESSKPTDFNDMARIDGLDAASASTTATAEQSALRAVPFQWKEPEDIPPRSWIYGRHYIRQFVSITGGVGGVGKSSLQIVEALAIATGKPLLGKEPTESCPVWYINLEDPSEEIDRRIMAAAIHYGLKADDLDGRLFRSSGRDARFIMATDTADGIQFVRPDIDAFERQIKANGIGVTILDPFVKLHRVPENSNDAIDKVLTELARIGDIHNCSIELAHHLRKSNGNEPSIEDLRGASSLLGAVRSSRLVVPMTESEKGKAGVEEHQKRYMRVIDGKANMAPPSENSEWVFLESHDLKNATKDRPADWVGVATEWEWPDAFDGVTSHHANEVRGRVADGSYRENSQAEEWVGIVIADVLDLDLDDQADKDKVKSLIKTWLASGVLKVEKQSDGGRKKRKFVAPGSTIPGANHG